MQGNAVGTGVEPVLAVRVGFGPTVGKNPTKVFKTFALDHYATSPSLRGEKHKFGLCDPTRAEDTGVEPVNPVKGCGLANRSRGRLSHPPGLNRFKRWLFDPTSSKYA